MEYALLVIGGLILVDALFGEKGALEIAKARPQSASPRTGSPTTVSLK